MYLHISVPKRKKKLTLAFYSYKKLRNFSIKIVLPSTKKSLKTRSSLTYTLMLDFHDFDKLFQLDYYAIDGALDEKVLQNT